jgi:outer membrane murein-binding lipoprotein Lpp
LRFLAIHRQQRTSGFFSFNAWIVPAATGTLGLAGGRKAMAKQTNELSQASRTTRCNSETAMSAQTGLDELHSRIQSKLDELHADFKQLESDVHAANQESSRARKDRIEGFKRALRDMLEALNRADREWQ